VAAVYFAVSQFTWSRSAHVRRKGSAGLTAVGEPERLDDMHDGAAEKAHACSQSERDQWGMGK
jgi:hypothetical protein